MSKQDSQVIHTGSVIEHLPTTNSKTSSLRLTNPFLNPSLLGLFGPHNKENPQHDHNKYISSLGARAAKPIDMPNAGFHFRSTLPLQAHQLRTNTTQVDDDASAAVNTFSDSDEDIFPFEM